MNTTVEQQVREYYDHAGPAYHALMGQFWHHGDLEAERAGLSPEDAAKALARKQIDAAGLRPGDTGLDFGSGVGGTAVYMAEISGANVVGVSNNEWLSARAREYAAEQGMGERAAFLTVGDEDYKSLIAWPDGSLDMVSFYESVCHLPDKAAFFAAAFRTLKPGACLVGVDWIRRPFGEYRTEEQIAPFIGPVQEVISIPEPRHAGRVPRDDVGVRVRRRGRRGSLPGRRVLGQHAAGRRSGLGRVRRPVRTTP